jgi:16S rRNA (cytidine1402-2'-O)-methyltransferase
MAVNAVIKTRTYYPSGLFRKYKGMDMKDQAQDNLAPGLYMVATPIGNLEDLSFRALRVLKHASWIAAEDTRETKKLLNAYDIATVTVSLHEHSGPQKVAALVERLQAGSVGAYVSDAGTPGISDPGAELAAAARAAGISVYPVPGSSAPVALLSIAGFQETAFTFHGFFPRETANRRAWLGKARASGGLHVFFESPHRINAALAFLAMETPHTPAIIGRELTKKFETVTAGSISEVAEILSKEESRGEYVVALNLPKPEPENEDQMAEKIRGLLEELAGLGGNQKLLTRVAISHGVAKNRAYALSLEILKKP